MGQEVSSEKKKGKISGSCIVDLLSERVRSNGFA